MRALARVCLALPPKLDLLIGHLSSRKSGSNRHGQVTDLDGSLDPPETCSVQAMGIAIEVEATMHGTALCVRTGSASALIAR